MVERILELLKMKNLTPSQFADEIGIQRSGMSHIISGRNNPSLEFVMKVLKRYPDLKPEWLLYGTIGKEKGPGEKNSGIGDKENEPVTQERPIIPAPASLFDEQEAGDVKPEIKVQRAVKKEKAGRKIEKIIVFYDDRSFREYDPEQ
ncbi:MAG: helix-turn-helix transcriptional regulator [Bacteroidota bacterium]